MFQITRKSDGTAEYEFDLRSEFDLQPTRLVTADGVVMGVSTQTHFVRESTALSPRAERAAAKARRAAAVEALQVTTTSGHTFDGDEVSQGRMARAVVALQATGAPGVRWTLADNSTLVVSAQELAEALALAGAAQAQLWALPGGAP